MTHTNAAGPAASVLLQSSTDSGDRPGVSLLLLCSYCGAKSYAGKGNQAAYKRRLKEMPIRRAATLKSINSPLLRIYLPSA